MSQPDVSIILVNWNCGAYLARCLTSLYARLTDLSFEVLVVDNHSQDDSVAQAKALNLPVRWFCLEENLGFGRANNLAAAQAQGKWLLLLNPDTELEADCLTPAIAYATAHPEIGLLGVHHLDGQGNWQRSFGIPIRLIDDFTYVLFPQRILRRMPSTSPEAPIAVGWLAGSYLLMSRALYEQLGLFDPEYFLNDEDIDLAERVRRAGYQVIYHPMRGLRHFGGVSKAFKTDARKHHLVSRKYYYQKYHGRMAALAYHVCFIIFELRLRWHAWRTKRQPH
jgi:N-acetylglucosaminyl-diphospho-decaprenol L-rhamnosyltransferase